MVNRTNKTGSSDLANECIVQVVYQVEGVPLTLSLRCPLEFFTGEIMVKSIRFMPDIPPDLMKFVESLREIILAKQKV